MQLSANFGELRSNHWHMGLDIRTNKKENQPVYAAAGGHIAKVGIRAQSFGRFIIIEHPNGLSTLYAHLNDFFPELETWVTEQQYSRESWAVELEFTPGQFPVQKGKFIAYSGNTGGSGGPHLHFEIFNTTTGKRLNPQLFFRFPVSDPLPPTIVRLALYDRDLSLYEQSPQLYVTRKTREGYLIPGGDIIRTGVQKLSVAIQAYDKYHASGSPNGILSATLYENDREIVGFVLDSIGYDETLYMNAHIDYRHDHGGGVYLQHLSKLPGDKGPVYREAAGNGIIVLTDTLVRYFRVEVKDAYGNLSELKFALQFDSSRVTEPASPPASPALMPGVPAVFSQPGFELQIGENAFYDRAQPVYETDPGMSTYAVTPVHHIRGDYIPVHEKFLVRIKPGREIPGAWENKILIQRQGKNMSVEKAEWKDGWLQATFGDFGSFQAFADIVPPVFNDPGKGDTINLSASRRLFFTPRDNFGIKSFRAELDGKWIRFTNDKGRNWIYMFDDRCPYGVHHLKVTVEDLAGNVTTREWWFRRNPYTPKKKRK